MDEKDIIIAQLTDRVQALTDLVERLEAKIARLEANSSNSSKPPSSDLVKPPKSPSPKSGRRKLGGQPGHAKHERTPFAPEQIDGTKSYELAKPEAAGLEPLDDWQVIQQIELTKKPFEITEHRARKYRDSTTGQIVLAPLPPDVRRSGLVGPRLSALIVYQKSACRMSYTAIQTFLKDLRGLTLSTGQLVKVVQKASAALGEPYEALRTRLADQPRLGIDETGPPENGENLRTWCFRADDFTVFAIDPVAGRGRAAAGPGRNVRRRHRLRLFLGLPGLPQDGRRDGTVLPGPPDPRGPIPGRTDLPARGPVGQPALGVAAKTVPHPAPAGENDPGGI